jgi:capsular exopolysaccharide synthesis family protein
MIRTFGYRAYMISSPEPLTGKTTAAVNLAFALAEDPNRRVALIEANFRYPRISAILGTPEDRGLVGVLKGQLSVVEAIVRIADRNLVIFPSGGRHANPNELLASPRFKTLIQELADTVDVAIIDAPSVKPFADANLLLPLVDGVLLTVLDSSTHAQWVDQVVDQLGRERVLGAIYNQLARPAVKSLELERRERMHLAR